MLRINNLETSAAMNAKMSVLFMLKQSYGCYNIIYMTVRLMFLPLVVAETKTDEKNDNKENISSTVKTN